MRTRVMLILSVLVVLFVAGTIYAQAGGDPMRQPGPGVRPGVPGMGAERVGPRPQFGERPGFARGPRLGGRRYFGGRFGFEGGSRSFGRPGLGVGRPGPGGWGFARGPYVAGGPRVAAAPPVVSAPQPAVAPQFAAAWRHLPAGHLLLLVRHGVRLLVLLAVIPVLITLFWVLPITLGVCIARRRKLSPLWMLFGISPLGGWIACLVLALSKGKVECASCGGYVKRNFRQCPFCESALPGPTPAKPPA